MLDEVCKLVTINGAGALRPGALANLLGVSRQTLLNQLGPAMEIQRKVVSHAIKTNNQAVLATLDETGTTELKELVKLLLSVDAARG